MKRPIYLDYAATTPVDPKVVEAMVQCLSIEGTFGNAASRSHLYGWQAEEAVESARKQVAQLIRSDIREIVWTSGATESNNLAIKGAMQARTIEGVNPHIVTTQIEHKAVLDTCAYLAENNVEITYVAPMPSGRIDPAAILAAIGDNTVLVSVMHANNETGVINDVATIGRFCRERNILFHVDAAQSLGKIDVDVQDVCIDLLSMSAHKMYGPKGIGALYVRRSPEVKIQAQIHGGGHERGMRSGTLATHQIVGFGKAAEIAQDQWQSEGKHLLALRERFISGLADLPCISINGELENRLPGNVNMAFANVDGETLLMSLRELAISSGSACMSASMEPSYVLAAMGVPKMLAHNSFRFSFGRFTTDEDIKFSVEAIRRSLAALNSRKAM